LPIPVQVPHQFAFAIAVDAIAEDEVVHPAADIDRVDLNVTQVSQGGRHIRRRGVEEQGPAEETAGDGGRDF
jgi:hypothetical protein